MVTKLQHRADMFMDLDADPREGGTSLGDERATLSEFLAPQIGGTHFDGRRIRETTGQRLRDGSGVVESEVGELGVVLPADEAFRVVGRFRVGDDIERNSQYLWMCAMRRCCFEWR